MKTTIRCVRMLGASALAIALLVQPAWSTYGQSKHKPSIGTRARVDLVVSGGTIVTMDGSHRVIEDGALAITGGKIVAVGTRAAVAAAYVGKQNIDARGKAVIPGLINGHTHAPMSLFRGLADDLDLNDWLTRFIFPAEARNVSEEFVRAGTRLSLAEMIRGGTTTYCDMYYFEDAVADETEKAGVRGVLGETVIDFPVADNKTWDQAMAYVARYVARWQGNRLITPAIAPHAPYTVSADHLKQVRAFSDKTGVPIVIHVAETRKEVDDLTRSTGLRPIDYLQSLGFLNDKVIAAHVVLPSPAELEVLKRAGVGVVHNPQSNMKLASGVAPVPAMLVLGIPVGLGTDGAASNNDLDMWEEMDTAAKLHKLYGSDPKLLTAVQALEMATIGGARALHLDRQTGSIETGKAADVLVVDLDALNQVPYYNIYSVLVYATKANDVRTVVIDGKIVMRDRSLLTLEEKDIKTRAAGFRESIWQSLAPSRVTPQ